MLGDSVKAVKGFVVSTFEDDWKSVSMDLLLNGLYDTRPPETEIDRALKI